MTLKPSSGNYTIDDAEWNTPSLSLSPGWNMITDTQQEFLNQIQVDSMRPLLSNFQGGTVSWTTSSGSSNLLTFNGSDIWVYGQVGPNAGAYSTTLNNGTPLRYSGVQVEVDHHHLLYAAHGLSGNTTHTLTMTNLEEGKWLVFDYAVVKNAAMVLPLSSSSSSSALPVLFSPSSIVTPSPSAMTTGSARYHPTWTPAAYCVAIFGSIFGLVLLSILSWITYKAYRHGGNREEEDKGEIRIKSEWYSDARDRAEPNFESSYNGHSRPRPATRILEALKGRLISNPVGRRDTTASAISRRTSEGYLIA